MEELPLPDKLPCPTDLPVGLRRAAIATSMFASGHPVLSVIMAWVLTVARVLLLLLGR